MLIICYTFIMDIIKDKINERIDTSKYKIEVYDSLVSTNMHAKSVAKQGAPEGTVIIARSQTGGYGRMKRSFYSPCGSGLYMSLILRPKIVAKDALKITTAAAVAVSDSIELISGKKTGIKWVNDIFIGNRKVCGILTEAGFSAGETLDYAILGIGVNIYTPTKGFPNEIADIAGGIYTDEPEDNIINILCAEIINKFNYYYTENNFLDLYRSRSIVLGKKVTVCKGNESYTANVVGIDDDLRLLVKDKNENIAALDSGEISIRL